jgi:hypothetical protein
MAPRLVKVTCATQISGREQDRVALAVGARDLAFKLAVEREIAAEQPRIAVADTIGLEVRDPP